MAAAAEAKQKEEEAAAAEVKMKAAEAAVAEAKRKAVEAAAADARRKESEETAAVNNDFGQCGSVWERVWESVYVCNDANTHLNTHECVRYRANSLSRTHARRQASAAM